MPTYVYDSGWEWVVRQDKNGRKKDNATRRKHNTQDKTRQDKTSKVTRQDNETGQDKTRHDTT